MDRDELLRMLDVKPPPAKIGGSLPDSLPEDEQAPVSDTALTLDKWDLARGEATLKNSPRLKAAQLNETEVADLFGCAYLGSPAPVESCEDPRRLEYVKTLLESPEGKSLRASTVYRTLAAEMAANELGVAYAKLKSDDAGREAKNKGKPRTPEQQAKEDLQAEMSLIRAAGQGVRNASEKVEELQESLAALGCGEGEGGESELDLQRVRELFGKVQNHAQVRRIMELAGRYMRVAMSKQRQKTKHGYDDIVGVKLSGDVSRLTPGELLSLSDDELSDDALRRILERQALSYDYHGVEPQGRGPIVICVDESRSMSGEPIAQAKAFALSMYRVARHQKRFCVLIGFAGGREGTACVLPPGKRAGDDEDLLKWLSHFYDGGTTLDVPIDVLPNKLWPGFKLPKGKTDVILITDAIVDAPPAMIANWNQWRAAEKARCVTLVIGGGAPGDLAKISDEVYPVRAIDASGAAVQKCMSV